MIRAAAMALLLVAAGCATLGSEPAHLHGLWGGEHIGITFEGALGTIEYDCASGTIDSLVVPAKNGHFTATGTHRSGQGGPVRVGQIFTTLRAKYSGEVTDNKMKLTVGLEDGTTLGPFSLERGAPPTIVRCL